MDRIVLGRTGLEVGVAALGAGGKSRLGQARGKSRADSVALVRQALDAGANLIDTAAAYDTEEIVGEGIRGRRDEAVISTKVMTTAGGFADLGNMVDAEELEARVDQGLKRLGIDCIDILHLHGVAPEQYEYCLAEFAPRLERMRQAGKIRFTGLTERFVTDTTHRMLERALKDDCWDVLMIGLNFVNQTALRSVLPEAKRQNLGTLCMFAVRGPLARRETAEALLAKLVASGEVDPAAFDAGDPLGFLTAPGVAGALTEAAYRFCRHAEGMDVVVTGTGDAEHLAQNLAAINAGPLPRETLRGLEAIFGGVTSESAEP